MIGNTQQRQPMQQQSMRPGGGNMVNRYAQHLQNRSNSMQMMTPRPPAGDSSGPQMMRPPQPMTAAPAHAAPQPVHTMPAPAMMAPAVAPAHAQAAMMQQGAPSGEMRPPAPVGMPSGPGGMIQNMGGGDVMGPANDDLTRRLAAYLAANGAPTM